MNTKKILVGGCFNIIHPGHIYFLQTAKCFGNYLIVVLSNDKNNLKKYKTSIQDRVKMLKELKIIDKIIIGDENNFYKVIDDEKPDIVVLGYDQELPEKDNDKKYSFKTISLKKYKKYETKKY
jgi:FAD synthetase